MIRAAIVGIGRWGRMLVNSVQDKSTAIRFTAGHTRTRSSAEAFCADNGIALKDDLDAILADPAIDAVVFATPHSQHAGQVERTAAAGKHVFQARVYGKAVYARCEERRGGPRRSRASGDSARGCLPQAFPPGNDRAEGAGAGWPARNPQPLREFADGACRSLEASELLAR